MAPNITQTVSTTPGLKTLKEALIVSGIDEALDKDGPYTLFAPSEDAFAEMGIDALVALASVRADLVHVLRSHIIPGKHMLRDLVDAQYLKNLEGSDLYLSMGEDDEIYVEEARIVRGDIVADNGIIHVIDLVVLPLADEVETGHASGLMASLVGLTVDVPLDAVFDYETALDQEDESVAV